MSARMMDLASQIIGPDFEICEEGFCVLAKTDRHELVWTEDGWIMVAYCENSCGYRDFVTEMPVKTRSAITAAEVWVNQTYSCRDCGGKMTVYKQ
jgi:hypothetical protein